MKLPVWLILALAPVAFIGGCTFSIGPIWEWQEQKSIHPVRESEKEHVPLLAVKDGKYVVTGQANAEGATVVTSVSRKDEEKINRDLCDQLGAGGSYRYFRVLDEKDDVTQVSLEAPTLSDSKRQGWYTLDHGAVRLDRFVYYGPGFAYIVMPWTLVAGFGTFVIYLLIAGLWITIARNRRSK